MYVKRKCIWINIEDKKNSDTGARQLDHMLEKHERGSNREIIVFMASEISNTEYENVTTSVDVTFMMRRFTRGYKVEI